MKKSLSALLLASAMFGGLNAPVTGASGGGRKMLPQSQWKKRKKKIKMQKQSRRKQR